MAHYHWKELFPPHIWQRGLNYYRDGNILDIHYRGGMIVAEIEGSDVYTVSVSLDKKTNRMEYYSCDCPYGEDGTPCKHLAALLCALEDGAFGDEREKEDGLSKEDVIQKLSGDPVCWMN